MTHSMVEVILLNIAFAYTPVFNFYSAQTIELEASYMILSNNSSGRKYRDYKKYRKFLQEHGLLIGIIPSK